MRQALRSESSLQTDVNDGIGAVRKAYRTHLAKDTRAMFGDSLDLDSALQRAHPGQSRWDYLLGHSPSQQVLGLEPHSAKEDQVSTVIRKRRAAKQQLASHLKNGKRVTRWLWVASGKVQLADTERARRRLDENGIEFVGKQVKEKHLPAVPPNRGRKRR
ncbi:MAG: hypothetical protein MJD61_16445 [Proteobacteria bacterium]|nr:hypothetical protein [Pseudomonadota bacterium]